jgi:hypothetical protein
MTMTTPSRVEARCVPRRSEASESLSESTRLTGGDTASASVPSVVGEEATEHQATEAMCTTAVCGKSDWRSQVEKGAVTGDAASTRKIHAQTARIIDRGGLTVRKSKRDATSGRFGNTQRVSMIR